MRSDAEEGVAKGCKKWRKMEENVEKTIRKGRKKLMSSLEKPKKIDETVGKMRTLQEGNS
jgi:hypothetical protein